MLIQPGFELLYLGWLLVETRGSWKLEEVLKTRGGTGNSRVDAGNSRRYWKLEGGAGANSRVLVETRGFWGKLGGARGNSGVLVETRLGGAGNSRVVLETRRWCWNLEGGAANSRVLETRQELSGMDPGELTSFGVPNLGEVTVSDANMKKVVLLDLTACGGGGDGHRFCIVELYEPSSSVYAVIQSNASLMLRHCEPPNIYALGERPAMFLRGDAFSEWWKKLVEAVISDDGGAKGELLGLEGLVVKAGESGFTVEGGVW
eukprot:gene26950-4572_t